MPNHARARLGEVFRILFDVFPVVLIKIASKNGESDDQPQEFWNMSPKRSTMCLQNAGSMMFSQLYQVSQALFDNSLCISKYSTRNLVWFTGHLLKDLKNIEPFYHYNMVVPRLHTELQGGFKSHGFFPKDLKLLPMSRPPQVARENIKATVGHPGRHVNPISFPFFLGRTYRIIYNRIYIRCTHMYTYAHMYYVYIYGTPPSQGFITLPWYLQ